MNDAEAGTSGAAVTEDFNVFLNHRGPDVKATFVAHLGDALRCAGFRPFLDARSLMKGDPALQSIDQALDKAKVHIAVVSKGYAESKYCLNELVAMMRSGKPVVPVFYGVEPGQLRRVEDGPFAEAFEKHRRRRTEKKMQEWRDALCALASLTGFRLDEYKSDEAKLKQEVVNEVARLTPSNEHVELAPYIVGLKGPINTCIELLENMGDEVGILGLVGMGGVGKTILASKIYNHYVAEKKFKYMTFLEVHKSPSSLDVQVRPMWCNNLRDQVLWDFLRVKDYTSHYGSWFQKVAHLGPVLIVIDDVHKLGQFEALVPSISFLHPGSRIIITSRDCNTLNNVMGRSNVQCRSYNVCTLGLEEANMLFNWHAFNVEEAPMDYTDVAKDVVEACGGLPLALKVMGCHLYDKRLDGDRETIWVEAVKVLKRSKDIMDVLRWSYDSLAEVEKVMFLDIACMFYDKTIEEAMACWKGCEDICCGDVCTPHTSLRNLINKNLVVVRVASKGHLGVHDLLRDLGHDIATKTKRHCLDHRLLEATRFVEQASMDTIGVNLEGSRKRKFEISTFASMQNLHYLRLPDGSHVNGNLGSMPKKMRLLQWRGMPLANIPMELNMKYMVSLDFSESPNLDFMWTTSHDTMKVCHNLLKLNLSKCPSIIEVPDFIGQAPRLKHLDLSRCGKLKKLSDSVGKLKELEVLDLSWCDSLKALPDAMTYPNLHTLKLYMCKSISKLPDSIGQAPQLKHLDLSYCVTLKKLPDSVGQLKELEVLDLTVCYRLEALPDTMTNPKLQSLQLASCSSISKLPDSIGQLTALCTLNLYDCVSLKGLPDTIGGLSSLRCLNTRRYDESIMEIPTSIGLLSNLEDLYIVGKTMHQQFIKGNIGGQWTKLKNLSVSNWGKIGSHLDYGALQNLSYLYLDDSSVVQLPDSIGLLVHLANMTISCERLESLPTSIGDLKMLIMLKLSGCKNLRRLPTALGALTELEELVIKRCCIIKKLPKSMGLLSKLWLLKIKKCSNLQKLPKSMGLLSKLHSLELKWCPNLRKLPSFIKQLKSLESIQIEDCGSIEAMGALTTLQGHPLWGCTSITNLPTFFGTISTLYVYINYEDNLKYLLDNQFDGEYETLEEDESGFLRAYESSGAIRLLRCAQKESRRL